MNEISRVYETRDNAIEERQATLRSAVESNKHLTALVQIIANPHYSDARLDDAVRAWNNATDWTGGHVELSFPGAHSRRLVVMMDHKGNIRLRTNHQIV